MFTIAAGILFVVPMLGFVRATADAVNYKPAKSYRSKASQIIATAHGVQSELDEQVTRNDELDARIEKQMVFFDYRDVIPILAQRILASLPNKATNTEQTELYESFSARDINAVQNINRKERKKIYFCPRRARKEFYRQSKIRKKKYLSEGKGKWNFYKRTRS